jgi:protein involved in polysaccharide export with SLBB domain
VLHLPGVASIPLAGLTVEEAARRISAEDSLEIFDALVTYLPLDPEGREALEPFGYLTFKGRVAASFQPPTDMPVPQDYVVGPGDIVSVQLFGNVNAQNELPVNRDGNINFPEIGPIAVAGLEFSEMRDVIEQRVGEQMIGVRTSITMGELRSIRVFVLGDVNRPGSYSVSSLSTVTNAMYLAGGVAPGGTLRDVQIKRNGKLVRRIDGYEFMLRGDTSDDIRLQPGDVIFVPPVGVQVGIEGEVRRPAIYEINGEKTVADVIDLAGGTLPTAYRGKVRLERVGPDADRRVVSVDLRDPKGRSTPIVDGDVIYVDPVIDRLAGSVRLTGHLYRPGAYQWTSGMRLSDLIPSLSYLKPKADRNYLLIRREIEASGPVSTVSADLEAALRSPHSDADPVLLERDEIFVFDLETGRKRQIGPILEDLALQASFGEPGREVAVSGHVRAPGRYPLEDGMRVSDLIRAGAGLQEAAYGLDAELTRYVVGPDRRRQSELVKVSLAEILAGDSTADVLLQPYDILQVKETPLWREQWSVEIRGEVNFPGKFAITSGETLLNVLERAGGLTEFAFPEGSVFIREDLKEREREQLNRLADRIESDLATIGLQAARFEDANVSQTMGLGQSLLSQMRDAEPVGRLVIDLPYLLEHSDAEHDLVLKDGDTLIIPGQTQTVTVLGEVQYSTSHLFRAGLDRDDYLSLSGGLTVNADKKRIYVVKANGAVVVGSSGSKWFRRSAATGIEAGDTIVVPLDVDRMPSLALWRTSTTILYNLAISVAAIGSL